MLPVPPALLPENFDPKRKIDPRMPDCLLPHNFKRRKSMPAINQMIEEFLLQSNRIEDIHLSAMQIREYWHNPDERVTSEEERHARNSVRALKYAMTFADAPLTLHMLLELHRLQMEGLLEDVTEIGCFRVVPVWVGPHETPAPGLVPGLIARWLNTYNSKQRSIPWLHFEFESIHPFVDGNGRTGRLIWAMDRLRRGNAIIPILDGFGSRGNDFYERRAQYYTAIQSHRGPRS